MSGRGLSSSTALVLSNLEEKKKALEESRLSLVEEIGRIDCNLQEVRTEYAKIVNASSHILKLPTEVTCMIFNIAVTSRTLVEFTYKKKPQLLPEVAISHVCRQWRDASINYPQLWRKFYFHDASVMSLPNAIDKFKQYIQRSGSQKLELFLDFREAVEHSPERRYHQEILIGLAEEQVERWKVVTLLSDPDLRLEDSFHDYLFTASAPHLEYFAYSPGCPNLLATVFRTNTLNSLDPKILAGGIPKLRYLLLDSSSSKIPPFSNITTLRIEVTNEKPDFVYTWEAFQAILLIPSLANLSIVGSIFRAPDYRGMSFIIMNNLKHLRYSSSKYMTPLLPFLRVPLLETLMIHEDEGSVEEGLLSRGTPSTSYFFPSLQSLTLIESIPTSPTSAWLLAQLTRTIESIVICEDALEDDYLTSLQDHGSLDKECWPKLTSFSYRFSAVDMVDYVADLVRSRPKNMLKLWILPHVHTCWNKDAELTEHYEAIKENCIVEIIKTPAQDSQALGPQWPPKGLHCPDYAFDVPDDPFFFF